MAEEVVQDAFMRALERPREFRRPDNPEAWLRTVAVNAARSRWRRSSLFRALAPRIATSDAVAPQLREDSLEQVATTLGIPVGTVKARLSRGLSPGLEQPPARRRAPATGAAAGGWRSPRSPGTPAPDRCTWAG